MKKLVTFHGLVNITTITDKRRDLQVGNMNLYVYALIRVIVMMIGNPQSNTASSTLMAHMSKVNVTNDSTNNLPWERSTMACS